ncbi:MAG: sterol desaturase family protein [Pseudomonadales bacterium]
MEQSPLILESAQMVAENLAYIGGACLLLFTLYEAAWRRNSHGRKTREDWQMAGIALTALALVQRPLLMLLIFFSLKAILPQYGEGLTWLEQEYFWVVLPIYMLIDEYLHGRMHLFTHSPRPRNRWLHRVQSFYRVAHRPHHQVGGNDGRGELSATQTYVEHWGWWLALPNYWFGFICLYLGMYETFFWGTLVKTIWGMHVHTNWGRSYDIVLLNHPSKLVRQAMQALCHVFVFPNMHQHHHSRGANSAKNMTNFISIFDWLLWDTLIIERERPEIYGWRQSAQEEFNPLYRYFNTSLNR